MVLDDWLCDPVTPSLARDLVEVLEDRSTLVTTQVPVPQWHGKLGDPDLSDAIMDRLVHNAYRLEPKGDSQRKQRSPLTQSPISGSLP